MVLSLPGRILALGANLDAPFPEPLRAILNPDLATLLAQFEPVARALDLTGAHDWSDFHQRMHYIIHLFRSFQATEDLFRAPFTPEQVEWFTAGKVPDGDL
jgi:hypothetical protein